MSRIDCPETDAYVAAIVAAAGPPTPDQVRLVMGTRLLALPGAVKGAAA